MTLENLNVRIILCVLISVALVSVNLDQMVLGQNSTSDITDPLQEQSTSEASGEDNSDAGNGENESNVSDNSTQTTDTPSQSNSSSTTQNANSTDSSDQEQQSGNSTSTSETHDDSQNQNSTSNESSYEDVIDETQSSNSTHAGNHTGTTSEEDSSAYGNNTQTINENANSTAAAAGNSTTSNQNAITLSPDYDIGIEPLITSVDAGSLATYTITVTSLEGFNSNVSLAITSKSIPGITPSLSSNMTLPPVNGSSSLLLTVQSDPAVQSGEYKFKVTGSSANFTDKSVSVKLEVLRQNMTAPAEEEMQFDPVALTPVLIKDMQDNIIDDISSERMVLISTTVINNYDKTQPFIVVVEVRDKIGTTLYLQLQKGVLNPLGEVEVAISWIPEKAGTYQVRTFAIDQIKEDPEPLSAPVGKTVEVK